MYVLKSKNNDLRLGRGNYNLFLDLWFRRKDDNLLWRRCGCWFGLRHRFQLCLATKRKNYSGSDSNIMVGLLGNFANHIILDIESKSYIVRQPDFRSYTNVKSGHVTTILNRWTIVGASEPGNDKGVE